MNTIVGGYFSKFSLRALEVMCFLEMGTSEDTFLNFCKLLLTTSCLS